ncbi:MAG: hypothetical protein RLZZ437_1669 [Pseudomonadota bacterium]|jgi:hypothetical protein
MKTMHCVAFAAAAVVAQPALAKELVFTISNNGNAALVELYASPKSAGTWGADMLGGAQIASGEAAEVVISGEAEGSCDYDLRMVFDDGSELVNASNLCDTAAVAID